MLKEKVRGKYFPLFIWIKCKFILSLSHNNKNINTMTNPFKAFILFVLLLAFIVSLGSCSSPKNVYMPKGTVHSTDVHRNGGCGWNK
jgi:hypothetical protein